MCPLNDNKFWITHQTPYFTSNNGTSFYQSTNFEIGNMSYQQHDFQYNECVENVSYFGSYSNIYKSIDNGLNYQPFVVTPYNPVNSFIESPTGLNISRANPEYIYVYYSDSIYVSKTGNSNFINITNGLPTDSANIAHLAIDPINENKIWISFKGYINGKKVFFSNNAGQTWTNISAGIPNLSVNKIVCQNGVPGAIYAATDGGVFYRDDNFTTWQYFNDGMPATIVSDIEIQNNLGKIRAATFGRGVWESDFYSPTPASFMLPPVALFQVNLTQSCPGEIIQFNNTSCGVVDSVHWIFNGASPNFSNANNPSVNYASPGNYDVVLIAFNQGGIDTLIKTAIIQINPAQALPYYEPVADTNIFIFPDGCYATDPNNDNNNWLRIWYADGSSGAGDDYLQFNNWNYDDNGLETKLYFPPVDLSNSQNPKLFFYRSYQRKNTSENDTLLVYAKACGGNETIVFKKGGAQLANIAGFNSANYWMPSATNHWLKDSISLLQFAGQPSVTFNFANKGYGGQIVYIDNFLVKDTPLITENNEVNDQNTISVYPNPTVDQLYIERSNNNSETIILYDLLGREITQIICIEKITTLPLNQLQKGIYILKAQQKVLRIEKL
jgi:PKD repeat protein